MSVSTARNSQLGSIKKANRKRLAFYLSSAQVASIWRFLVLEPVQPVLVLAPLELVRHRRAVEPSRQLLP